MAERSWDESLSEQVRTALDASASTMDPRADWGDVVARAATTDGVGAPAARPASARHRGRWLVAAAVLTIAGAAAALSTVRSGPDWIDAVDSTTTTTSITTTTASTAVQTTTTVPTSVVDVPEAADLVDPPDLLLSTPGRAITFDGIGAVEIGQVLAPEQVSADPPGSGCGYWPDGEVVHSSDASPTALVDTADPTRPMVTSVYLRNNPSFRTASGVGIGTSLTTLERIYGNRLVVDEMDGWQRPTDGLLASYQPVAAVRDGDRAITFSLTTADQAEATVAAVKVSDADDWGDDEGCA